MSKTASVAEWSEAQYSVDTPECHGFESHPVMEAFTIALAQTKRRQSWLSYTSRVSVLPVRGGRSVRMSTCGC